MRISTEAVASSLAVSLFAAAQYCSETLVAGRSSQRVHEKQIADILRYHVNNHEMISFQQAQRSIRFGMFSRLYFASHV